MAKYNDIYMRAYQNDPGNIPRSSSYSLAHSPDLIPYGTQPVDPQTFLTASSWNTTYNATLIGKATNYLYMRAQNLGTAASTGTFALYYSPGGNMLLWPSKWAKNQLLTQTGANTQTITLQGGEKGVLPSAFVWDAKTDQHYCLIGMVSTPEHPATPPPDGDIQNFATWIAQNGSFAWHNLTVTSAGSPTWTDKVNYDQGGVADTVRFDIVCDYVPLNSTVSFSCGAAGPKPPINMPPSLVTNYPSFIVGMNSVVPGDFMADISYSYTAAKDKPVPPEGFSISIEASVKTQPGTLLHGYGKTLAEKGYPTPEEYMERVKANRRWDSVKMEDHEAYAEYLLREHMESRTYDKSALGPVRYFAVGSYTTVGQNIASR